MTRRVFVDAPQAERCLAPVVLRDYSLAQCGRKRVVGALCRQHETIRRDAVESGRASELQRIQDDFACTHPIPVPAPPEEPQ